MMTEIITTKRDTEINRLLERVIRDHRKDISAYSKGHLNENNLWQPPESRRSAWPTSKLPAIRFKNPVKVNDTTRKETMWQAVACFSAGSSFKCDLPNKHDRKCGEQEVKKREDDINLEEFDASYMLLPRSGGHTYEIVPSIHGCLTRKEEVEQRKLFENKVIEKHNLTDRGWYDGSRVKELLVKNISSHQASKQLYDDLWDDLCKNCLIYEPLLGEIRCFYNGYLDKLTDEQEEFVAMPPGDTNPDIPKKNKEIRVLQSQVDQLEDIPKKKKEIRVLQSQVDQLEDIPKKNKEIRVLQSQVDQLEDRAMELLNKKTGLKEELDISTAILSEIQLTDTASYTEDSVASDDSYNIGSQIESLRKDILQQQADLNIVKSTQRRDMVPAEVYHCMIQCVQSSELEIQKQIKTIQLLEQKQQMMQDQLNSLFKTMDLSMDQCEALRGLKISLV